jgi:hypothetical protein
MAARPLIIAPELAAHIIRYDSDDPATFSPTSVPVAALSRASQRAPIPWPAGLAPTPAATPAPSPTAPLPGCDVIVVTWTVEEAKSLADTLTPGFPSKTAWFPYAHLFETDYKPLIRRGAPSLESNRLGSWYPTRIGAKRVICFKSELHLSQDGPKLPIAKLWAQLIQETGASLIITIGTAGGIGAGIVLGDVVVASSVRFDCQKTFASTPFHNAIYPCPTLAQTQFPAAQVLFAANTSHLPPSSRPPRIFTTPSDGIAPIDVVTTDFFAFDDSTDHYELENLGAAVEMGDAVLGMVISQQGAGAPAWAAVRNASDPQIDSTGLTLAQAANKAAQIYERFGYWTTIPSAITCWAIIAGA